MVLETKQEVDPVLIVRTKGLLHSIQEKLKTFLEEKKSFKELTEEKLNLTYISTEEAILFIRKAEDFTRNIGPLLDDFEKVLQTVEGKKEKRS